MDKVKAKPSKPRSNRRDERRTNEFSRTLRETGQKVGEFARKVWQAILSLFSKTGKSLQNLWHSFLRSFARWADPRLEPYRDKTRPNFEVTEANRSESTPRPIDSSELTQTGPDEAVVVEQIYNPPAPETREDLFALLREAPMSVLTAAERKAMAAVLSLPGVQVSELMTPATKIVFVNHSEALGPLVLDRLYHSGFTHFPVIEGKNQIVGTLETTLLNSLDVKETRTAKQVMDPRVYYIRSDYSLEQALKAFLRTSSQMMLVVDHYEKLMGMLTFAQLIDYLFSEKFRDDFDRDNDRLAVAKRK